MPGIAFVAGLVVLGLGLLALREARALRRLAFVAERPERLVLSLGEEEKVPLTVHVRNLREKDAGTSLTLSLRQLWPDLIDRRASQAHATVPLRAGSVSSSFELPVRAVKRGSATLGAPWLTATRDGWIERIVEVTEQEGSEASFIVLPSLLAVRRMRRELDRMFLSGLGSRAAPRLGKGREFDRLREYVPGDDLRDVAWKSTARHGKPITREYRLDRAQDVLICVDRGHRMAARIGPLTRLDHAANAAVLLASICDRMEDRVGFLGFDDEADAGSGPSSLGQGRGMAHLRALTARAAEIETADRPTDYLALAAHLRRRLKTRSLVVIVTILPELDEERTLARAVAQLMPKHVAVVLTFADPALEAEATALPTEKPDLCRALVARDLWVERRRTLADLRRRGALVVEAPPGDAGIEAVNAYLEVKRRQLL
ncbi:MAG TPA: DUF58 domain-containing protein [Thermoanaerobaculia bacterium]|nr:DUF58 domain-containing protein [Thermoanaerobaculia bacterium]